MKDHKELIANLRATISESKREMLDEAADVIERLERQMTHNEKVRKEQGKTITDLRKRLKAYEDTGLEPEVIEDLRVSSGSMLKEIRARESEDKADKELFRKALDTYGAESQTRMVLEEFAELQKELCKHARGKNNVKEIAEEIADVQITLEQMIILHNCALEVREFRLAKLNHLAENLMEA